MSRFTKRLLLLTSDVVVLVFALWVSFSLRLDDIFWPAGGFSNPLTWLILSAPLVAFPSFLYFGLYRAIIRYLGMRAVWSVVQAVTLYALLWGVLVFLSGVQGVPRSVVIINLMVSLIGIGGTRMLARWLLRFIEAVQLNNLEKQPKPLIRTKVVIFGAGEAGRQLAVGLSQSKNCKLLGFVDDNDQLQGRELMSLPIMSSVLLESFVKKNRVDDILLAVPSIDRTSRNAIIERLRPLKVRVRTMPGLLDMAKGRVDYSTLSELDINDLLARNPAECDEQLMESQVSSKVVMITGAGGSIGSELCRQILKRKPKTLLLFESNEYALFTIHTELTKLVVNQTNMEVSNHSGVSAVPRLIPLLGSVCDERRIDEVLATWSPEVLYHAAALKHVPLVEQNIPEGIKTNVIGTLKLAQASIKWKVGQFVLISTDKAVNPTNAMGATKRCCELILQALAAETTLDINSIVSPKIKAMERDTHFCMVRFGNVLGSSGSVVPHFREQIKQGGPVTLTHSDITRYFMTIPEAAQLVIQAGAMADKSISLSDSESNVAEVYVLDMGEPVKIMDLATRMVELSGHQVKDEQNDAGDIRIEVIGLRPGEKLYEELLIGNNPQPTSHSRIMKAQEAYIKWNVLQEKLSLLGQAAENGDVLTIRSLLKELVPEYQPAKDVADWVFREKAVRVGVTNS